MSKVLFVINPISGSGQHESVVEAINTRLVDSQVDYRIAFTQAPGHAYELAKDAASKGMDVVVAVGGDGTMHEVGKGLIGTSTALGIIPRGSGNGMARNMNIPMKLGKAIDVIRDCKTIKIDTVSVNDERYIGIAGVGFDALIAWEFSQYGKRGFQSYVALTIKEFAKYKNQEYKLWIDGVPVDRKAFFISFANSSQFGNNAVVSPNATINDGLIDVCFMKEFPSIQVPLLAMRLFSNTMDKSRYMEIIQGKEIIVQQKTEIMHLDGDPFKLGSELNIRINPLSLNVVVPGFKTVKRLSLQKLGPKL